MEQEWKQMDILWLSQLDGIQDTELKICDSASLYLTERKKKQIAHRYTTVTTGLFFLQLK